MQPVRRTRTFFAAGLGGLDQRVFQLVRALAGAGQVHADVDLVVVFLVLLLDVLGDLFELFDCHSTAHLSSCSSICSPVISPATSPSHRTTGARLQAPTQRAVIRLILPSLVVCPCGNAEPLFRRGDQLVSALDVAGGAGADGHGVLAGRLEAEVVVEGHHSVGLAQRHAQGAGHKADGVVVQVAERGLHGVQRFNQRVAGKAILAHGAVHDLPSFVVAGQRRRCESWHDSSVGGTRCKAIFCFTGFSV